MHRQGFKRKLLVTRAASDEEEEDAIFCQDGHHPEHLVHHQHNEDWSSSSNAIFYQLEVPAHLVHKLGYLWWRRLSVGPPFEVLPETRGHSTGGSPHRIAATNKHNIFMNNI